MAAVTVKVWGEYVSLVCQVKPSEIQIVQRCQKHGLKMGIKSLLCSFSKPTGFAQRRMIVIRLARIKRLFLSESECHTL